MPGMKISIKGAAAILGLAAILIAYSADCLSDAICDNVEAAWQSDEPRLEGQFPFYTLLVSCTGNLNLESYSVDSCVNNGTDCGPAAADAFCNYLGLDGSAYDNQFTVILPATAPTHSMTGEWCIRNSTYTELNDTSLQAIESFKGPFCSKLDSVLCYRSRNSSSDIFNATEAKEENLVLLAPEPAPSIADVVAANIANCTPSVGVVPAPQIVSLTPPPNTTADTAHSG